MNKQYAWNKLPAHVRLIESFPVFKTALNIHYLKEAFHQKICALRLDALSIAHYYYLIICMFLSLLYICHYTISFVNFLGQSLRNFYFTILLSDKQKVTIISPKRH